jgi:RNase P subunit RPR2
MIVRLTKTRFQMIKKGKTMQNHIVCPNCKTTLAELSMIEDAAKGEGSDTQSIKCECGEKITYWHATAQLRKQKTLGYKLQNWIRSLSPGKA